MKNLLLIWIVISTLVSSCDCEECVTYPDPLRIIFEDSNGANLLEGPSFEIGNIETCSGNHLDFLVKDFVVSNTKEITHLEIASDFLLLNSIGQETCFTIEFSNQEVDTIRYKIDRIEGKCCDDFRDSQMIYNGVDYLGKTESTIGAYQIIK